MPSAGPEISRQTDRAIDNAASNARRALDGKFDVTVSVQKDAVAGLREVTIKTLSLDGKPLAKQQVLIMVRSRSAVPTLSVDFTIPSPGVENVLLSVSQVQLDKGFTVTPAVSSALIWTDDNGEAVFSVTATTGDSVVIKAMPMYGMKETTTVWAA